MLRWLLDQVTTGLTDSSRCELMKPNHTFNHELVCITSGHTVSLLKEFNESQREHAIWASASGFCARGTTTDHQFQCQFQVGCLWVDMIHFTLLHFTSDQLISLPKQIIEDMNSKKDYSIAQRIVTICGGISLQQIFSRMMSS